jgi:GABA permease
MWLFPYLSYATLVMIGLVIGSMYWVQGSRSQLLLSFVSLGLVLSAYGVKSVRARAQRARGPVVSEVALPAMSPIRGYLTSATPHDVPVVPNTQVS